MEDPSGSLWNVIGLFLLIGASAFFSGSETALTSVSKLKIRHLVKAGAPAADILGKIMSSPSRLLTTLLIGNNIVNIAASSLATVIAIDLFGRTGVGVAMLVMTILILIFGEITPKTLAAYQSEAFSLAVSRPISYLMVILKPVVVVFVALTNLILSLAGGGKSGTQPFVTEEELKTMVEVGEEEGVLNNEERQMIHHIFEFGDMIAEEIMIPRIDVVGVSADQDVHEAARFAVDTPYSRLPVYAGTIDQVVGFIHVKDLLRVALEGNGTKLRDIVRPVHFVPEAKKVDALFAELRHHRTHMAVVLDEYGATAGIVTMEDLVEEIVGDINDEYDVHENLVTKVNDSTLVVDGRTTIEFLNDIMSLALDQEDADTVGGFVFSHLGRVPKEGEYVVVNEGVKLSVEKMRGRRIVRVRVETAA